MQDTISVQAEPFTNLETLETPEGNTVSVGDKLESVKPTYVSERVPAVVVRIYNDPRGLLGGRYDSRGQKIGTDENGDPVYEHPSRYECVPTVRVRFEIPDGHDYDHLDGAAESVEIHNTDYSLGLRD